MRVFMSGMEWFPDCAGGLNRYFYDEMYALSDLGITGSSMVAYLQQRQAAPFTLYDMAPPTASLGQRLRGAKRIAVSQINEGVDLINVHFALYALPWLKNIRPRTPLVIHFHGPWADEMQEEIPTTKGRLRAALARSVERKVYRRGDRVVTLSRSFSQVAQNII